ncbi:MAG: secretin and TonB N-terminal domain-containing protein, partial [Desulfatitalea sp.]|nr:secretin and TonB N-terminal domain-containing protein [Desulfatitalea sp.]
MNKIRANIAAFVLVAFGLTAMLFGCAAQTGPGQTSDPTASTRKSAISSVSAVATADEVRVTIAADGPLTFSSLKQPDPPAVVLYLPETSVEQTRVIQPEGIDLIKRISATQGNGQTTARIEVQLAADMPYIAVQEGNSVQISFDRAAADRAMAAPAQTVSAPSPSMAATPTQTVPAATVSRASVNTTQGGTAWVNKVDFLSESDGKSTLVVGTTRPVDFRVHKTGPQSMEIRLLDTRIPSYRQRPLITTRFNSAVDRVLPVQPDANKSESVITIELRESVPYVAEQADNMLFVYFDASGIPPKPLEQAQLPAWQRVLSGTEKEPERVVSPPRGTQVPLSAMPGAGDAPGLVLPADDPLEIGLSREDIEIQELLAPRRRSFTGEKIALDFYDTDVKNVFRILREVSGQNFAIDRDVTGKVTMTLDKPVPWDQVLDLVLRMNQLGMVQEGAIVRIATAETLKREEDLRRAQLESLRKAREEVKALEPLVTKYIPVSYSSAQGEVRPHIENILTKGRGSVTVDTKNNQIIITDTVAVVRQAEDIVRRIDKVTSQVVIEARVVEVTSNFS